MVYKYDIKSTYNLRENRRADRSLQAMCWTVYPRFYAETPALTCWVFWDKTFENWYIWMSLWGWISDNEVSFHIRKDTMFFSFLWKEGDSHQNLIIMVCDTDF